MRNDGRRYTGKESRKWKGKVGKEDQYCDGGLHKRDIERERIEKKCNR